MDDKKTQEMLDFAISIVTGSGMIARKYFRSRQVVKNKSEQIFDPVTRADHDIEKYLRTRIHQRFPTHGIIGEEHDNVEGTRYTWVIDPIDGTRGFVSGSLMWGSLLGLMDGKRPLIGVMHQPYVRETFYGGPSGAGWKSGKKTKALKTSNVTEICNAVLYSTHPAMFSGKKEISAFKMVEKQCRYSRYGADCYGYCLLASGFVDIVIEGSLQAYDIIPLIPIVKSAGGVITDWEGGVPLAGGRVVAAANKKLHRQLIKLLND